MFWVILFVVAVWTGLAFSNFEEGPRRTMPEKWATYRLGLLYILAGLGVAYTALDMHHKSFWKVPKSSDDPNEYRDY
jgi:hypothetical protein